MLQALPVEMVEHVRLVLAVVETGMKFWLAGGRAQDPGVVAGGERVEPERAHAPQHQVEAHEGVAADAGVGGPASQVSGMEGFDDALAELSFQVPHVVRHAEQVGHPPRVLDGRERATAAVPGALLLVSAGPLLKRDADHLVALADQEGGRHAGVDAS